MIKLIIKLKLLILLLPFSCYLFSCKNKDSLHEDKYRRIKSEGIVIKYDSLASYNPFQEKDIERSSYKVVSYINVSCPPCIEEINKWNEFYKKYKEKNIYVKIVCYSDDYFEYFKYLYENGKINKFPFPFLFDTSGVFLKRNIIFKDSVADNTVITDSRNKVIAIGNPLHSSTAFDNYNGILNE